VANERKPPGDRISDHIAQTLTASGLNAEVFNFGVPNYTSINEHYLILSTLIYHQPDLILVYDGVNDAFYGSTLRKDLWKPNTTNLTLNYKSRMDIAFAMPPFQRLRYVLEGFSYTYYFVSKLNKQQGGANVDDLTPEEFSELADSNTEKRTSTSPVLFAKDLSRPDIYADYARFNADAVNAYLNNIRAMAASLDSIGISFLHVLQPTALTKKKLYPREKWSIDFNNAYYEGFQEVTIKTLREFRDGQQRIAKTSIYPKARFLDLSSLTDSMDEYLYDDYCHAYKNGRLTAVVGHAIGEHILRAFNPRGTF
jgi:lysophospholipase L1-like esterase